MKCARCGLRIKSGTLCPCGYDISKERTLFFAPAQPAMLEHITLAITEPCSAHELSQKPCTSEDETDSLRFRRMEAEDGDPYSQFMLGHLYEMGEEVALDYAEAGKWYRLASAQGYGPASWALGNLYEYQEGEGQGPDSNSAVKWFLLAGEQGLLDGYYDAGIIYKYGERIAKDIEKSVKYFRLAAEQGHSLAQCTLGELFSEGEELELDLDEAKKWYKMAAEQGDSDARETLERLMNSSAT